MLTLKQQLDLLLAEAKAKPKAKAATPVKKVKVPEEDEEESVVNLEDVEDEEEPAVDLEDAEETVDALASVDLTSVTPEESENTDREAAEEAAVADDEGKSTDYWKNKSGYPPLIRRFITFFLEHPTDYKDSLSMGLSTCIEGYFNPESGIFKPSAETLLEFYNDFKQSLLDKAPVGLIRDLIDELLNKELTEGELARWDAEIIVDENGVETITGPNKTALKALKNSFRRDAIALTKWFKKEQQKASPIELTLQDINNLYIGVNIVHQYMSYKYYNAEKLHAATKWKYTGKKEETPEDDYDDYDESDPNSKEYGENTTTLLNAFQKESSAKDKKYFSSWYFVDEPGVCPDKRALKNFVNSAPGIVKYLEEYLGPMNSKLLEDLCIRKYITQVSLFESTVGDVGVKGILTEVFVKYITIWFMSAFVFGENLDKAFGECVVLTIKNMSPLAVTGETAKIAGKYNAISGYSLNDIDEVGNERGEGQEEVNAVTGMGNTSSLSINKIAYDSFWETAEALTEIFNIGAFTSNLSRTLTDTISLMPDSSLTEDCDYYTLEKDGTINPANLLRDYRDTANDPLLGKDYVVRELTSVLTFLKENNKLVRLIPSDVNKLISELPKTQVEGLRDFEHGTIGGRGLEGGEENLVSDEFSNNAAVDKINMWFTELCNHVPRFRRVSPGLAAPVSFSYFKSDSAFSKQFGINIAGIGIEPDPEKVRQINQYASVVEEEPEAETERKSDKAVYDTKRINFKDGVTPVNIAAIQREQFEDYFTVVKSMLMPPEDLPVENWGFLQRQDLNFRSPGIDKNRKLVMYPIFDDTGNDITPRNKSNNNHLVVFPTKAEYTKVANNILTALRGVENEMLSAKTPEDLHKVLIKVESVIPGDGKGGPGDRKGMLSFRSPDTISYKDGYTENSPLAFFIGSRLPDKAGRQYGALAKAIFDLYKSIEEGNPLAQQEGRRKVGVFIAMAMDVLRVNNLTKTSTPTPPVKPINDSVIRRNITTLIEDSTNRVEVNKTLVPHAIINIHLRAKVLLAISELFDQAAKILEEIKLTVDELPEAMKHDLSLINDEAADNAVEELTKSAAAVLSLSPSATEEERNTVRADYLKNVKEIFHDAEAALERARGFVTELDKDKNFGKSINLG